MKIELPTHDFEHIASYLHRIAGGEPPRKKNERKAAMRLGNLIAVPVAKQKSKWLDERIKWKQEELKMLVEEEGMDPDQLAEVYDVSREKINKILKRFGLLEKCFSEKEKESSRLGK